MNDTTYTVDGFYDTSIKIRIPNEDNINYKYNLAAYDVSSSNNNAVLIFLENTKSSSKLTWDEVNSYTIPGATILPNLPIADLDNVLIIVLHDPVSTKDINQIKKGVDTYYAKTDVATNDRQMEIWPAGGYSKIKEKEDPDTVPRVVGMTIIKRTQS